MIVGLELGGTKCVATLAEGTQILAQERVPTGEAAPTLDALSAFVSAWQAQHPVEAIGVAAFGPIRVDRTAIDFGTVLDTPKPGWKGFGVASYLRERHGLPVGLDSDVNGAALAEGRWGGAVGMANHAYVTVGTGVGVGCVVGGRTLAGRAHSEFGHLFTDRLPGDTAAGSCPFHGPCVEGLVSGPALAARTGVAGDALADDDPVWEHVVHVLARMLHAIVLVGAPERIALGGGVPSARPGLVERVAAATVQSLAGYSAVPFEVGPPLLGDQAGPLGAIAVALDELARSEGEGDAA